MRKVNLYQAKTHLSQLVAKVEEEGEVIVLCRNGRPVADLVPHQSRAGTLESDPELLGARYLGDPTAPLDAGDWPEELR